MGGASYSQRNSMNTVAAGSTLPYLLSPGTFPSPGGAFRSSQKPEGKGAQKLLTWDPTSESTEKAKDRTWVGETEEMGLAND